MFFVRACVCVRALCASTKRKKTLGADQDAAKTECTTQLLLNEKSSNGKT